jgi:hypothetical protein
MFLFYINPKVVHSTFHFFHPRFVFSVAPAENTPASVVFEIACKYGLVICLEEFKDRELWRLGISHVHDYCNFMIRSRNTLIEITNILLI